MLVAFLVVVLSVPAGVAEGMVARHVVNNAAWQEARQQARLTAVDVRAGRLTDPIVPRVAGIDLVQVVKPGHDVVASSIAARGRTPMTEVWPTPQHSRQDVQICGQPQQGCMRISAVRVCSEPDSLVVYAGRPAPDAISTAVFDALFAVQVAVLIFLAVWATWRITGRMLRPVETIRAELAAINANDLSTRVPEPPDHDEIARLAHTVNRVLERLEHAKARTERALAQQRQFAADASHELRTPVAGLRMQLEEARLYPDDADVHHVLDHALGDLDRLQAIINDLLLLARLDANAPEALQEVNLPDLVETGISQRTDRHPVQLQRDTHVVVNVIPTQIIRVLTNLLDNAQRHATHTVQVQVSRSGGDAEVSVTDDGAGIAETDRERIFRRFTRLDAARSRNHGGTGLGLAIARDIAHAHHGTLHVEDAPTGGARFILRLPLASRTGSVTNR